jgi:hypothetical protein
LRFTSTYRPYIFFGPRVFFYLKICLLDRMLVKHFKRLYVTVLGFHYKICHS